MKLFSIWKNLKKWKKVSILILIFIILGVYIFATFFLENIIRNSLSKELKKKFDTYYDVQFDGRNQSFNGSELSITFSNIKITTDTTHEYRNKYPVIFFNGDELKVEGLSAWSFIFAKNVNLENLVLVNGDLDIHLIQKDSMYVEQKKKKQSKLSNLNIEWFELQNVNLNYWSKNMDHKKMVEVQNVNFKLQTLNLNMKQLDNVTHELHFEQVYLGFDHLKFNPTKGIFSYQLDSLRMDYEQQALNIYNVQTVANSDQIEYTSGLPYAKMMVDVDVPHLSITNLNYDELIKNSTLKANSISLNEFKISLFKNNHVKTDTEKYQSLIQDIMLELPIDLNINTIHLDKGDLTIDLLSKKRTKTSSELELSNISGVINHVVADTTSSTPMEFRLIANIQEAGILNFNMDFDFSSPTMEHHFWGTLHQMPLKSWNGFLFNFANIKFKEGEVKSLKFDGLANRDKTWGEVEFLYNDLKIELSARDDKRFGLFKKKKFITSLANTIIRNDNPNNSGENRKGHFEFERVTYKGHFHMFVMGVVDGIKSVILDKAINDMLDKRSERKKHH